MKINIEIDDCYISVEMDKTISKKEIGPLSESMYTLLKGLTNNVSPTPVEENTINTPEVSTKILPIKREDDKYNFRPRIPNNIIDVNDLDIKQAVTEKALVRCPNCGQAHCVVVNSGNQMYFMERDFTDNEFNVIESFDSLTSQGLLDMCCKKDTDKLIYFEDLQSVYVDKTKNVDFVVDNESEMFCPVCHESNTFHDWKLAYEEPLSYFETEHICDICGGEKLSKIIKDKQMYECDLCGHQSEYTEE